MPSTKMIHAKCLKSLIFVINPLYPFLVWWAPANYPFKIIRFHFTFPKIKLPRCQTYIFQKFPNFFLHFSSSWVKVRLHLENQLHVLSGSALKVYVGGWWVVGGGGPTNNLVYPNYS